MVSAQQKVDRPFPDWRTMKKGPDGRWIDGIRVIDGETFLYVGEGRWWPWKGFDTTTEEKDDIRV